MKANELMIGDWVKFDGRTFKLCDVTVINPITNPALVTRSYIRKDVESPTGSFNDALIIESALPLKDIYPIPLTEEILKKNDIRLLEVGDNGPATPPKNRMRFEKWLVHTMWKDTKLWHDRLTGKWHLDSMNAMMFENVHELQHALRLCGIEKEIML